MTFHRSPLAASFLLCALLVVALPGVAAAQDGRCGSPRAAVATFLDNLQPDRNQPKVATQCFDWSAGPSDAGKQERVARDLKAVLDGRGLYVDYAAVPSDAEHVDDATGLARVTLFSSLPDVYLEKRGGTWLFSQFTVRRTPQLINETFLLPMQRIVQRLPGWMQGSVLGVPAWKLLGLTVLILLAVVLARVLEFVSHAVFRKVVARWFTTWNEDFERAIVRRLSWVFAAGAVAVLLPNLGLPVLLARFVLLLLKGAASVAAVLIATVVVDLAADALQERAGATETRMDDQLVPLLRRSSKVLVWVIGVLFILQNMHVDVSSLLGSLAIGGLAFSLAAKDTVANLFGSITIFTDRPFQIGDSVNIGGVEGTVEEVGFRSTRIRTFADSLTTLPNSTVANATIDNMGKRRYRRFKVTLGLTYDTPADKLEAFVAGVRRSIQEHPTTRKDAFEVHFNAMSASSLDVLVYCFFETGSWNEELQGKQTLMLTWMRLASELGVEFAFPTQTLHVEGVGGAAGVAGAAG